MLHSGSRNVRKLLLAAILIIASWPTWAHDHLRADLAQDFANMKSVSGTPCCDGTEATHIVPDDWSEWRAALHCQHTDRDQDVGDEHGQYCVRLQDTWWNVSDKALVQMKIDEADALVWPLYQTVDETHKQLIFIRCFRPGPGS
jgi:hypothetical protein